MVACAVWPWIIVGVLLTFAGALGVFMVHDYQRRNP